jgi:hypothetical protein
VPELEAPALITPVLDFIVSDFILVVVLVGANVESFLQDIIKSAGIIKDASHKTFLNRVTNFPVSIF